MCRRRRGAMRKSDRPNLNLRRNKMAEKTKPDDTSELSDLWLDPGLGDGLTDTHLTSIPMDKPRDFFRVHPDRAYRRLCEVYTHKPEGQIEVQHFLIGRA